MNYYTKPMDIIKRVFSGNIFLNEEDGGKIDQGELEPEKQLIQAIIKESRDFFSLNTPQHTIDDIAGLVGKIDMSLYGKDNPLDTKTSKDIFTTISLVYDIMKKPIEDIKNETGIPLSENTNIIEGTYNIIIQSSKNKTILQKSHFLEYFPKEMRNIPIEDMKFLLSIANIWECQKKRLSYSNENESFNAFQIGKLYLPRIQKIFPNTAKNNNSIKSAA